MGYVDLHSHWLAGVDDGARTPDEGLELLRGLGALGFSTVIATPHMRPGLFNNTRADLESVFASMRARLEPSGTYPETGLGCEHFFNDIVYQRLMTNQALPYPGHKAALIEFPPDHIPAQASARFFDLRCRGLRPVLAHPERYNWTWKSLDQAVEFVDKGIVFLLDVAALSGKYGKAPCRAAESMLEQGLYYAACSDAHRPADLPEVARGIERLGTLVGKQEAAFLLSEGPRGILQGQVDL